MKKHFTKKKTPTGKPTKDGKVGCGLRLVMLDGSIIIGETSL